MEDFGANSLADIDDKISELRATTQSQANSLLKQAEDEVRNYLQNFSTADEEAVENEVEELLKEINQKPDLSAQLKDEMHARMQTALRKCMLVLAKQKVRDVAAEADLISPIASKAATAKEAIVVEKTADISTTKRSGTSAADALMIQMLQKKVASLKKQIEVSDQKARTVTLQW